MLRWKGHSRPLRSICGSLETVCGGLHLLDDLDGLDGSRNGGGLVAVTSNDLRGEWSVLWDVLVTGVAACQA